MPPGTRSLRLEVERELSHRSLEQRFSPVGRDPLELLGRLRTTALVLVLLSYLRASVRF